MNAKLNGTIHSKHYTFSIKMQEINVHQILVSSNVGVRLEKNGLKSREICQKD